jgi:hypothetical protein
MIVSRLGFEVQAPTPTLAQRRVVFVGDLSYSTSSGAQRSWAMTKCGLDVVNIHTANYHAPLGRIGGYWAKFTRRFEAYYRQDDLERDILASCETQAPDLIWFEWPRSFAPEFFRRLKAAHPRSILISFQDDNPFGTRHGDSWHWRRYIQSVPLFDLHLCKRTSDIENLQGLGARNCRLWMHGIYRPLFEPPARHVEKIYPASFVGTCFDERVSLFEYLIARCKLPVHVFGSHWQKRSDLPRRFPSQFHPEITGDEYVKVIQQSLVCIGLVSSSNDDEWTMRTFEIPGTGGMLLAQRTPMHEALFREGIEAMFFSSHEECASAIRELLAEPKRALGIGTAAYRRCVQENRFLEERMKELLEAL